MMPFDNQHQARPWIIAIFIVHVATRVWSFVNFIPLAIKFQNVDPASQPHNDKKYQRVKWSRWRVPLGGDVLLMLRSHRQDHRVTPEKAVLLGNRRILPRASSDAITAPRA